MKNKIIRPGLKNPPVRQENEIEKIKKRSVKIWDAKSL
jgi:hypothetical protein